MDCEMEAQFVLDIKDGHLGSQFIKKLNECIDPVLNTTNLDPEEAKTLTRTIVKLLKQCNDSFDSSKEKDSIIDVCSICCDALQRLNYDYSENQVTIAKLIHFLMVKGLNNGSFVEFSLKMSRYLQELLLILDQAGNLPDKTEKSPLVSNSWTYIWNYFVHRQKDVKLIDFHLLAAAFRFHGFLVTSDKIFDKFLAIMRRYISSCENKVVIEGMLICCRDLLNYFVEKYKNGKDSTLNETLCNLTSISMSFALNSYLKKEVSDICKIIEGLDIDNSCMKLVRFWQSGSKLKTEMILPKCETENSMFCLTETLYTLYLCRWSPELEIVVLEHTKYEIDYLINCEKNDKFASERNVRATKVASMYCNVMRHRVSRGLSDNSKLTEFNAEVDSYEKFLLECMEVLQPSFFLKKLHELAINVSRFSHGLRMIKSEESTPMMQKAVKMMEFACSRLSKFKEDSWSLYSPLCSMYTSSKKYTEAMDLMEMIVVENDKNVHDIAAMYVSCKKAGDLFDEERYLASKVEKDRKSSVLKSELHALKNCRIPRAQKTQFRILEKLLESENDILEQGRLLLEKAIILYSTMEFSSSIELLNESLKILKENSNDNLYLARGYLWKYVLEKAMFLNKFKIIKPKEETDYKDEINDFNDNAEEEESALKFKDSFTLRQEHNLDHYLIESLTLFESVYSGSKSALSIEICSELSVLYAMLVLNRKYDLSYRASKLNDLMVYQGIESLLKAKKYEQALEALLPISNKYCVEFRLFKSRVLLYLGRFDEGYAILEPMCKKWQEFSTRNLGRFAGLLSEYQRLPLEALGVKVNVQGQDKNPLYLATVSLQCFERVFCKASGLQPDPYGNFPDEPDLKEISFVSLVSQYVALDEYLESLILASERYGEVGDSKRVKTYLLDALVLSLRYCLPEWTCRVLYESSKVGLLEGRLLQAEEKLRRAHWILTNGFMKNTGTETEATVTKETEVDVAADLLNRFGFDTDVDEVIKSKKLKTSSKLSKQQARSLVEAEIEALIPANHDAGCEKCGSECRLKGDYSLARLNLDLLLGQSLCFLQSGSVTAVQNVGQSLEGLLSEYKKIFPNPYLFKDIEYRFKITLAKCKPDDQLGICESLIEMLSLSTNQNHRDILQSFDILIEAYYLLGSQSLNSYLIQPVSVEENEENEQKKSLSDQLYDDDANASLQVEMAKESKRKKSLNEKPLRKNGRRKKKSVESESLEEFDVQPPVYDRLMTPASRISDVTVTRRTKPVRTARNLKFDDTSPLLTDAPKRINKRIVLDSSSSVDLNLKVKPEEVSSKAKEESPEDVSTKVKLESPKKVKLEVSAEETSPKKVKLEEVSSEVKPEKNLANNEEDELDRLLNELTLDPPKTGRKTKPKVSQNTASESKPKRRTRKNAVSDENTKSVRVTRTTRSKTTESLRTGGKDSSWHDKEDLIGEFKPDSSDSAVNVSEEFLPIETLRGPTRANRSRRKVLGDISDLDNTTLISDVKNVVKSESFDCFHEKLCRNYLDEAFKLLRHHPTALYRKVCLALAMMTQSEAWLSAFYLNEAACVFYRHEALSSLQKKRVSRKQAKIPNETEEIDRKVEEMLQFPKNSDDFKSMVNSMPADWTIVQISIMTSFSTNHMIVCKLRKDQSPFILQCPGFAAHGQKLMESFEETIIDSRLLKTDCEDSVRWWTSKRMYSKNVEEMIQKLENDVFGHYKGLLLGRYANSDACATVSKKSKELLTKFKPNFSEKDQQLLEMILDSVTYLTAKQRRVAVLEIFPSETEKVLAKILEFNKLYPMTGPRESVILIPDKIITNLPIDNMAIVRSNPIVRSLSIYSLYTQYTVNEQYGRLSVIGPEMTNISYILDPEYNLPKTRENFAEWFAHLGWLGTVGKCPSRQEFEKHLTCTDMMLYLGHGSGQRYYDGNRIQKLQCRAAVVLMGCSSGVLKSDGAMEPRGTILNYLVARSPFVMGNLWDVTDGDIDRFTKALLEYWLVAEPGTKLFSAMQSAREACRLRYLTGSAPVVYGLPL